MLTYGAAAVGGAILMATMGFAAILAVGLPFVAAVLSERFVNRDAEPDERLRSFVIYTLGMIVGVIAVLVLSTQLGAWRWIVPIAVFALAALIDYLKPPEEYTPIRRHQYGESPPVTTP